MNVNPNEDFSIFDDAQAKAFIASLGLLDQFIRANESTPEAKLITYGEFPSHWIAAYLFAGFSSDNGFAVVAWAKSKHTLEKVNGMVDALWKSHPRLMQSPPKPFKSLSRN